MLKIIKFGAKWCHPCFQLDEIMNEILSAYNTDVIYVKVDVEEDVDYAEEQQIRSVPTMIFEHDDKAICKLVGLHSSNEIKEIIDKYV